jgi:hypothetical protein
VVALVRGVLFAEVEGREVGAATFLGLVVEAREMRRFAYVVFDTDRRVGSSVW